MAHAHGRSAAVIASLAVVAVPAAAQRGLPEPVDDAERAVMPDIASVLAAEDASLSRMDAILARLPRPTPLRGMVQAMRAVALLNADRMPDAKAAAEEAVRLSPDAAEPRLMASYVLTFAGAPRTGAIYWLEASTIDPELARKTGSYELDALVGRLRETGEDKLADRLLARVDEIGVAAALLPVRSAAALSRLKDTADTQGIAAATPLVTSILSAGELLPLYVDDRYRALWPVIDQWVGADFGSLRTRYFEELRREWRGTGEVKAAVNYARALNGARAYAATVALFLPALSPKSGELAYAPFNEFLAPPVARALLMLGRRSEADAVLSRVDRALPEEAGAMRLNLSGSTITLALISDDYARVVSLANRWLATARAFGPGVNRSALLQVEGIRVCALEKLGRGNEATAVATTIIGERANLPDTAMQVFACRNDLDGARTLMIEALADPQRREWALGEMQPQADDPQASSYAKGLYAFGQRVRADRTIRAAAEKVGRILPRPIPDALPKGFDPLDTTMPARPLPGSV